MKAMSGGYGEGTEDGRCYPDPAEQVLTGLLNDLDQDGNMFMALGPKELEVPP